ncbi:MAG: hypothetical protein QOI66_1745 [Myxococcales bacterium]|jgi:hypothetical protein|nr:hypothetical protein [Myxococcales bacterium]
MDNEKGSNQRPFGITAAELPSVAVRYSLYSSKSGAGVEEIYLYGDGRVTLRRTAAFNAEPEERQGIMPAGIFERLLEIADDQRFEALDEETLAKEPGLRRVLAVRFPGREIQVIVDNIGNAQFERIVSAVIFAASLATPAVLQGRFFHLLGPI